MEVSILGPDGASYSPDLGLGAQAGNELERCQRQADEVTEIMLNNFDKVLERDGKLAELEQRSDQLLDMVVQPSARQPRPSPRRSAGRISAVGSTWGWRWQVAYSYF
ncbi:vesicle-associated membrane protein 5 isoform X2 [Marmota marmota marmota]|uniref:vesicle-associated membrane protein 5 isoform X2 n=1 Tax=Marmota marmota marmota TaxID=9994 RepID=UPI002092DFCC|nr:vesicle-associated membrane protein 5 isoform X2 [Marmota marmota marmota]